MQYPFALHDAALDVSAIFSIHRECDVCTLHHRRTVAIYVRDFPGVIQR
jgi:hypothetical protein